MSCGELIQVSRTAVTRFYVAKEGTQGKVIWISTIWAKVSSESLFRRLPVRVCACQICSVMVVALAVLTSVNAGSAQTRSGVPQGTSTNQLPAPLDLNTATETELKKLPGMGHAYAIRIIEGRPYTAKNQLVGRGILPADAFALFKDRVIAKQKDQR